MDHSPSERQPDGATPAERRREPRYPFQANAILRKENGESITCTAVDISSSGMQLLLSRPGLVGIDEVVTVEIQFPDRPEKPFSSWGIGRIAYVESHRTGIELYAGHFAGLEDAYVVNVTEEEPL